MNTTPSDDGEPLPELPYGRVQQLLAAFTSSDRLSGALEAAGMEPLDVDAKLSWRIGTLLGEEKAVRISSAAILREDDGSLMIADVGFFGSGQGTPRRSMTIAFYESRAMRVPRVQVHPEGVVTNVVAKLIGAADVDFEEDPDFSRAYHVSGASRGEIRRLFGPRMRACFDPGAGLCMQADGAAIAVFRAGWLCPPEDLAGFLAQAREIAHLARDTMPAPVESAAPETSFASTERLEKFLSHVPPRPVPYLIRRERIGSGTAWLVVIALFVFVVGGFLLTMSLLTPASPQNPPWVPYLSSSIVLVGVVLVVCAVRHWRVQMRFLRNGVVAVGRLEAMVDTGLVSGNEPMHKLILSYQLDGDERQGTTRLPARHARAAARFLGSGDPIRVLVDPVKPTRVIWAASLDPRCLRA